MLDYSANSFIDCIIYIYICILISNHAAHFAMLGLTIISGLNGWITGWWNSLTLFHWLVRVFLLSVYHYIFNVWLKPFNTIVLASLIINSMYIYIMIIIDINWQPLICYPTPYIYTYIYVHIYIYASCCWNIYPHLGNVWDKRCSLFQHHFEHFGPPRPITGGKCPLI